MIIRCNTIPYDDFSYMRSCVRKLSICQLSHWHGTKVKLNTEIKEPISKIDEMKLQQDHQALYSRLSRPTVRG